jgi:hypothetical protein
MQNTTDSDSRSPPHSGSTTTRAGSDSANRIAQPPLTSGFGAVIEKERELRTATEDPFGQVRGHHSAEIDRILHHQHSRLGANIALLEQRYEALPNPERFVNWNDRSRPPGKPRRTQRDETKLLPDLIARHTNLLADIEALIGCAPDGQRRELILTEVSRNHEEMAWMLTALLKEDETVARFSANTGDQITDSTRQAQENWDNEGGPVHVNRPAS